MKEFINSTAVARVNGYIGREGSRDQLIEEIDQLGLTESLKNRLLDIYGVDENVNTGTSCGVKIQ